MSNAETNKAVFRRFIECMDGQDYASVRAMFAPDFRAHPSGQTMPAEGYEQMGRMFYSAFPDGKHELHALLAEGDLVCARITFAGTHHGDFMGIAPTRKRAACTGFMMARIAGGKIAEMWGEFDQQFMQHNGLV
jgi:predicted ester cyclase